uniref:Kappa-carrageenase like protein n=1 Tax=Pseudoalteromonas tetraodonis TaxID=43659 RepID=E7FKF5_9GAMM|nr:kappa-carrageenase like protein [Pseudoalteromonas tetraodonis]
MKKINLNGKWIIGISLLIISGYAYLIQASDNEQVIEETSAKMHFEINNTKHSKEKLKSKASHAKDLEKEKPTYKAILDKALLIKDKELRIKTISNHLLNWAKDAPYECVHWLDEQYETPEYMLYVSQVIHFLITDDLSLAGSIILNFEILHSDQSIVDDYLSSQVAVSPYDGIEWLNNLNNEKIKQEAEFRLLQSWANLDPTQLLNYLEVHTEIAGNKRHIIQHQLAQTLTKNNSQQVQDEFYSYPPSFQPNLAYSVISQWPEHELSDAREWIFTLEGEQSKYFAIKSYIDYTGSSSANLNELIEQIHNPTLRAYLLERLQ